MTWPKPVRPGMRLAFSSEIAGKTELRSRPAMGLILSRNEARDGAGDLVFAFTGKSFVERRPPAALSALHNAPRLGSNAAPAIGRTTWRCAAR